MAKKIQGPNNVMVKIKALSVFQIRIFRINALKNKKQAKISLIN